MGSAAHARGLAEARVEVKAMISLEMIGYFSERAWSQRFPIRFLRLYYPSRGNFIGVVSEPTDTPDTLDYKRMAEVVRGVCWAVMNL